MEGGISLWHRKSGNFANDDLPFAFRGLTSSLAPFTCDQSPEVLATLNQFPHAMDSGKGPYLSLKVHRALYRDTSVAWA